MKLLTVTTNLFLSMLLLILAPLVSAQGDLGIGTIDTPPGVQRYQEASGADIGIIFFISTLINIFALAAGVWVLFNIVMAGYIYFTSAGDSGNHEKVRAQVTNSVLGLILIVMSYTIGGLIGWVFFGDAGFLLNPQLL